MDCVFCKIADGSIKTDSIYEDDKMIVFNDMSPQAPVHMLAIPKDHIESANELNDENADIVGHIFKVIAKIAKDKGFAESGYRIVNNCGKDGGQTVKHLHFHILAERSLNWPPG